MISFNTLYKLRFILLGAILIVLAVASLFLQNLKIDNSFDVWFMDNDPALIKYNEFKKEFGNDEALITVIQFKNNPINDSTFKKLVAVTNSIQNVDGIFRIQTLSSYYAGVSQLQKFNADTHNFEKNEPIEDELRKLITDSELSKRFYTPESNSLILYSWIDTDENIDKKRSIIINSVDSICKTYFLGAEVHHAGIGVVLNALNEESMKQSALFMPLSYLLIIIFVFYFTRSFLWTGIALLSVILTTVFLFECMGYLHKPLTMITVALPPLILIMSVANIMHFSRYVALHFDENNFELTLDAFKKILKPCLFNVFTTAAGFLSLASANMGITRDYGMFAAIAVVIAFINSFVGALLVLKKVSVNKIVVPKLAGAEMLVSFSIRNSKKVIAVFAILLVISIIGISTIVVDTYSIDFLNKQHPVRVSSEAIETHSGNYLPIEFNIHLNNKVLYRDPALYAAFKAMHVEVKAEPFVDALLSPLTIYAEVQRIFTASDDKSAAASILLAATTMDKQLDAMGLINGDRSLLRFSCMVPMASARRLTEYGNIIEGIAQRHFTQFGTVSKTGYLPLYGRLIENIIHDQVTSILLALGVISFLISILLRSFKMLIIACIVNTVPIIMILGIMGHIGIFLDIATVTIAPAMLGIIVDDTVHILFHLKKYLSDGEEFTQAMNTIAKSTGSTLIATTIILIAGFGIIGFADIKSMSYTGMLTAITAGFALVTDLMLLPAIGYTIYKRK
ncbi:MAG: MMPL family transporter [Fibrobacterales bacterium]